METPLPRLTRACSWGPGDRHDILWWGRPLEQKRSRASPAPDSFLYPQSATPATALLLCTARRILACWSSTRKELAAHDKTAAVSVPDLSTKPHLYLEFPRRTGQMKALMVGDGLLLGVEPLVGRKPEVLQHLTAERINVSKSPRKAQATASMSFGQVRRAVKSTGLYIR